MTGRASRIIHSGRAPEARKPSTIFMRLVIFLRVCLERVFSMSRSSVAISSSRSTFFRQVRMASAPIPAMKASGPYFSTASAYSSSVRS